MDQLDQMYPELYGGRRIAIGAPEGERNGTFVGWRREDGIVACVELDGDLDQILVHPEDVMVA